MKNFTTVFRYDPLKRDVTPASISERANIGPICFVYRGYPRICKVTLITARCMVKYQADIKPIYQYRQNDIKTISRLYIGRILVWEYRYYVGKVMSARSSKVQSGCYISIIYIFVSYWSQPAIWKHIKQYIGPILDDRLKEKLLKPWKGALCFHFRVCPSVCPSVRLSVCSRATSHTF